MKIGISVCSLHFVDDPRTGARHMIERTASAREAGLDSLFVGDHHVTASPYYQNNVILARMLAEWGSKPPLAEDPLDTHCGPLFSVGRHQKVLNHLSR